MPLNDDVRGTILDYVRKHLPSSRDWYLDQFDFIRDADLRQRLAQEFYASRYLYKLMEALSADGDELAAHVKFQVLQYASIYEAVVNYLLWDLYYNVPEVKALVAHKTYRPVGALSKLTKITYEEKPIFPCLYVDAKTDKSAIAFRDKVNVLIRLGAMTKSLGDDIKEVYAQRNAIHLDAAVRKNVGFEVGHSRQAYRRMEPFLQAVKEFVRTNPPMGIV